MRFLDSAFWKIQKRGDYLLLVLAIVIGCGLAYHRRWLCDDAFISFRYAQNLLRYGELVFNPGERVEGYTNFLWTLLLAGGQRLGLPPEQSAIFLGLISYAFLMFFFWALAPSLLGGARPLSLLALALHGHMTIFATSGLETMFFTMLAVTATLWISDPNRAPLPAFAMLGTSILVRPDGVVFFAAASLSYALRLWDEARRPRKLSPALLVCWARAQIGIVALIAAYWFWRWNYFDAFFPNTFYAKSAHSPYAAQGLVYIGLYFLSYWAMPLGALLLQLQFWRRSKEAAPPAEARSPENPVAALWPLCIAVVLWLVYVTWIGGDFMFARHMTPITPLLYLVLERFGRQAFAAAVWQGRGLAPAVVALFLIVGTALRIDPYRISRETAISLAARTGIVEESIIYKREPMERGTEQARALAPFIRESGVTIAFWGAGAFLVYYMDPVRAIEASTGLTEAALARRPLNGRGRIGHEKGADFAYLLSRGADISLQSPPPERDFGWNRITLAGIPVACELLRYDRRRLQQLAKAPGIEFVDFPAYLDRYIAEREERRPSPAELQGFQRYYFDHNADPRRAARLGLTTIDEGER